METQTQHPESQDEAELTDRESDRLRRRYEHYKVGYTRYKKRYRQRTVLATALGIACLVLFMLVVSAYVGRSHLETVNRDLLREVAALQSQLADAESELLEHAPEGLLRIEYDKLIPLGESYVKAVELSRPPFFGSAIRFQLLIENRQSEEFVPDVSIELFDRSGTVIVAKHALDLDSLGAVAAGNIRSFSGRFGSAHPDAAFFRVTAN